MGLRRRSCGRNEGERERGGDGARERGGDGATERRREEEKMRR